MSVIEWLGLFALGNSAFWAAAAVSWDASADGARIYQLPGPPPLPPVAPGPPWGRLWIDMSTGTAQDTADRSH